MQIRHSSVTGSHCPECPVRNQGFCAALGSKALEVFSSNAHKSRYRNGDELLAQGVLPDRIGVISEGLVRMVMVTEDGDERLLQILRRGQMVGISGDEPSHFSWEAATDVEICWVSRPAWDRLVQEQPVYMRACLATSLQQMEELQLAVMRMRGRNTLQRVACWIADQVASGQADSHPTLQIALSRRDLAALLDMTPETLCRALRQLDTRKVIRLLTSDCAEVTDLARLRRLARCPQERAAETVLAPDPVAARRETTSSYGARGAMHGRSLPGKARTASSAAGILPRSA